MTDRLFVRLEEDALYGPEADVPAGTLQAFPVAAPLCAHVAHILLYREQVPMGGYVQEHVLPDGALRLVFNFGDVPAAQGQPGHAMEAIGASAMPVRVTLHGRIHGISVTVRPGAAAALLGGMPAGELDATVAPLDALWGRDARSLLERMQAAQSDVQRVALLQSALQARLERHRVAVHPGAAQAAALIAAAQGRMSAREVAAAVGLGERRLQQLFHAHVGLTPRTWSRLARMQSCLRALRASQEAPAWADLAAARGFYDQAHLANEFRALCGMTPTEFLHRRVSQSSKTPP